MISLQPLHLTHSPSGTWIRLCSTGCFGLRIFLNHAISMTAGSSEGVRERSKWRDHIAKRDTGQEGQSRERCGGPAVHPPDRAQTLFGVSWTALLSDSLLVTSRHGQ